MQNLSDFSLGQIIALFAENSASSFFSFSPTQTGPSGIKLSFFLGPSRILWCLNTGKKL